MTKIEDEVYCESCGRIPNWCECELCEWCGFNPCDCADEELERADEGWVWDY